VGNLIVPLELSSKTELFNFIIESSENLVCVNIFILECHVEAPLTGERWDVTGIWHDLWEYLLQCVVDSSEHTQVAIMDCRTATLGHKDTTWGEFVLAHFIERSSVKLVAWSSVEWIGKVHDNHIEISIFKLLKLSLSIINDELGSLILKSSICVFWHMISAHLNDVSIDVNHPALLNTLVSEDLSKGSTLTTTSDVDLLGVAVANDRWLHKTLVVNMLVFLCGLQKSICRQKLPVLSRLQNLDLLELGFSGIMQLFDFHGVEETI